MKTKKYDHKHVSDAECFGGSCGREFEGLEEPKSKTPREHSEHTPTPESMECLGSRTLYAIGNKRVTGLEIAQAVNAHAKLVELLKAVVDYSDVSESFREECKEALAQA